MPDKSMPSAPTAQLASTTGLKWSSVVLLARDVNQSIFKPHWLAKVGILLEEEVNSPNAISVAGVTQITTGQFEFLVLPDRVQMKFQPESKDVEAAISRVLGGVVRTLPHTPFIAVGLNSEYRFEPAVAGQFYEWNIRLASPWAVQHVLKEDRRARFGSTFAMDALGARFRVRVKVSAREDQDPLTQKEVHYVADVGCNLNKNLPADDPIREITRMLSLWNEARSFSDSVAGSLLK